MGEKMTNSKKIVSLFFLTLPIIFGISKSLIFSQIYFNVSGKVIDEETGEGIKGVKVVIFQKNMHKMDATTNEKGEFKLSGLPSEMYGIDFRPPEPYAWDNIDYTSPGPIAYKGMQTFTIGYKSIYFIKKCKIGGSIELKTFEKGTNNPIEGVDVFIKGINIHLLFSSKKGLILTDNQGIYRLGSLPAGKCEIYLKKDGLFMKHLKDIKVQYKQTTKIDVAYDLASNTKITGRITCKQSNTPIKDIFVGIYRRDNNNGGGRCYSDDDGHYSLLDMEPGKYEIAITYKGENDKREWISKIVSITQDHPVEINFSLDCNLVYEKKGNQL
jgi:hypothetical protein